MTTKKTWAQFTPDRRRLLYEEYVKLLEKCGRTWSQRKIEEELAGDFDCDVRTIQRNLPRAKVEAGVEKSSEQQGKKEIDPVLVQSRLKHWDDLAGLCQRILSANDRMLNMGYGIRKQATVGTLLELAGEVDCLNAGYSLLRRSLAAHIIEEFPEISALDDIEKLHIKDIDKLALLAARRSFKGTCEICKSWSS